MRMREAREISPDRSNRLTDPRLTPDRMLSCSWVRWASFRLALTFSTMVPLISFGVILNWFKSIMDNILTEKAEKCNNDLNINLLLVKELLCLDFCTRF